MSLHWQFLFAIVTTALKSDTVTKNVMVSDRMIYRSYDEHVDVITTLFA